MSALLALGGAVFYGLSDFLGGYYSRRTSAWAVALVAATAGAVATFAAASETTNTGLAATRSTASPTWAAGAGTGTAPSSRRIGMLLCIAWQSALISSGEASSS